MKKIGAYFLYFLFWMIFFLLTRGVFLLYHTHLTGELSGAVILKVFIYGARMDASFAGYLCIFPFLMYLIKSADPKFRVMNTVRVYTIIMIAILSFLTVADLELYTAWGFRMDATPLEYFRSPKEMASTVSSAPVFILLVIFALLIFVFIFLFRYFNHSPFRGCRKYHPVNMLIALFLLSVLFIPIRGGIQKIPMNISDVYFSDQLYADHAAINLPWNIAFSLLNQNSRKNPFEYFDNRKAEKLVDQMYQTGPARIVRVIDSNRPNIIFIILESFTAKWVSSLGGLAGVTPQLDSIASNGLLFTNIYAAGDRSEKGQVAILSGYPNQAINSIIKTPTKSRKLPGLARVLESYGYTCSYTYGGELEFANIKSYLLNTGYKNLVSKYDFPVALRTTSWGVHDEYVFDRFLTDVEKEKQPFFSTIFSLSSHEPFDVPLKHFKGTDELDMYKNSVYYTDSVIGEFIKKLKRSPLWKNTLVVITADHGHPLPGNDPNDVPSKFHIPLIFTGGALTLKGKMDKAGSQTDIATTVLDQLGIPANEFHWGKDLLDSSSVSFAFYSFNNGFGWIRDGKYFSFDNVSHKIIHQSAGIDTAQLDYAKAYMQTSYQDYLNR